MWYYNRMGVKDAGASFIVLWGRSKALKALNSKFPALLPVTHCSWRCNKDMISDLWWTLPAVGPCMHVTLVYIFVYLLTPSKRSKISILSPFTDCDRRNRAPTAQDLGTIAPLPVRAWAALSLASCFFGYVLKRNDCAHLHMKREGGWGRGGKKRRKQRIL